MGGKSAGSGSQAYDYYGTIAGAICAGPVDELVEIVIDGKTVWPTSSNNWTNGTAYTVGTLVSYKGVVYKCALNHTASPTNVPPSAYWTRYTLDRGSTTNPAPITVTGYGTAYLYWGTSTQTLDASGEKTLSLQGHPPYRRQAFMVLKNFLFGREKTSAPNVEVIVRRKPNQSAISGSSASLNDGQANPMAAIADLFTDPVFGAGLPVDAVTGLDSTSLQATADTLDANNAQTYLSPILTKAQSLRQFTAQLLAYCDGWMRFNTSGIIEAGAFPHNAAAPSFTAAKTIDYNDLVEEVSYTADGWNGTHNQTTVKFTDRTKAFKDAAVDSVSGYNLAVTNEPRTATIDRPWITRRQQASDYAAEWGKINAEPRLSGSLVVRAEKAASIRQGDLFLLTHDALAVSIVCRCTGKDFAQPPAGRVTLQFENDRGSAPLPYQPTVTPNDGAPFPSNEVLSLSRFFQPPPAMIDGTTDATVVPLIARTSDVTTGAYAWLQQDDLSGFYSLGRVDQFAIYGTLQQDYAPTLTVATTQRARTSNVATLTHAGAVQFAIGQNVTVSGLADSTFNGSFKITAVTSTTISYANAGSDVSTTADTGGTIDPGSDDITESLRVTLNGSTNAADLAKMMSTQTEDAINDNAVAVIIFDDVARTTANRARTSNVATITTASAHNLTVGATVTIAGLSDSTFNGTVTVASAPSSTTFTYANTGSNVSTTTDTGGSVTPWNQFEVQTLRTLRVVGAETFYRVRGRRSRFGTTAWNAGVGSKVFIAYRRDLIPLYHASFATYLANLSTAKFRLQSINAGGIADVADTSYCPDISYTFTDLYPPTFTFSSVKAGGSEITDFSTNYTTSTVFEVSGSITDASADLTEGRLYAKLGTTEITIWSQTFTPSSRQTFATRFQLPTNGEWVVWVAGKDLSGRVRNKQLTAGGGTSSVTLKVGVGTGGTVCATPVASPVSGGYTSSSVSVTLSCSTSGATIKYQIVALGASPGGTWLTYSGAFSVSISTAGKTVWAYALKSGLTDSSNVGFDYWKESSGYTPPGTQLP